jgi:hypothetical protein
MTTRQYRTEPIANQESRRPALPLERISEGLFLGWGPKF